MLIKKLMTGFAGMVALFTTVITCEGCGTDYGAVPPISPEAECCDQYSEDNYQKCIDRFEETGECVPNETVDPEPADPSDPGENIYGPPSMMCCRSLMDDAEAYQKCVDKFEETGQCVPDDPEDPKPIADPSDPGETIYGPPSMMCCRSLMDHAEAYQKCVDKFEETGECNLDA